MMATLRLSPVVEDAIAEKIKLRKFEYRSIEREPKHQKKPKQPKENKPKKLFEYSIKSSWPTQMMGGDDV